MRFLSQAIQGDLILVRIATPPRPARAIRARSAPAAPPTDSLLIRLILWLLATFARPTLAAARALRQQWQPLTPETLPVLRLGIVFFLLIVGAIAIIAAKGG